MAQRLISLSIMSAFLLTVSACSNPSSEVKDNAGANSEAISNAKSSDTAINSNAADITDVAKTPATKNAAKAIDWSAVASPEPPADPVHYQYPFAIDSQNVRDYAEYFKVDKPTAQYNLTVGMAVNEPLSKVLDQLGTSYVSHELIDAKNTALIIHTTPEVQPSKFDYVIQGDFGKGLVLPIEIKPDGVKGEDGNPHKADSST